MLSFFISRDLVLFPPTLVLDLGKSVHFMVPSVRFLSADPNRVPIDCGADVLVRATRRLGLLQGSAVLLW